MSGTDVSEIPAARVRTEEEVEMWTSRRLAELKEKISQAGNAFEFKVDFGKNQKLDMAVGLGALLPPEVTEIEVVDLAGNKRRGKRREVKGKIGYFDENDRYIPIHEGYKVTAITQEAPSDEPKKEAEPEAQKAVENTKAEYTEPEKRLVWQHKGEVTEINGVRCYINAPDPKQVAPGKLPRIVVYFHGWGGSFNTGNDVLHILTQVEEMRRNGDPVVLVMPQGENAKDPTGKKWLGFDDPTTFGSMIEAAEKSVGKVEDGISIASFSGGWKGLSNALEGMESINDPMYSRIRTISLLDSVGDRKDLGAIAKFANQGGEIYSVYSQSLRDENEQLRSMIQDGANVHIADAASGPSHSLMRYQFERLA